MDGLEQPGQRTATAPAPAAGWGSGGEKVW